jgi:hypothetical protein
VLLTAVLGSSAGASTFSITPGGSPVTVTIGTAGTSATASFSGTAGQRVSLFINSSTISSMKISLVRASNGAQVFTVSATRTAKFVDTNTLPANGTYKLTVDPARTYTGHVTLTLYNVPADASAAVTPGGPGATVATTVPGQNASFTFPGVSGQRVALGLTGVTVSAGSVTVRNPDSSVLAGPKAFATAGTFIDPLTLTQTGTYTVFIDPKSRAKGKVTLTAYDVPADTNASLTLGSPASGSLGTPGQVANFTFTGSVNQRVSLNVESSDFSGTIWLKKDSTVVTQLTVTPVGGFLDATTLTAAGTYTVVVDPSGDGKGNFSFVVYDVPADTNQPITAGGSAVTVTNTAPGQNGYLTFTGTQGQRISVLVSNVNAIDSGELDVLKPPNGTSLLSAPITVTSAGAWLQPTAPLPVTGQYKILLDPQLTGVGTADVNLYVVPDDLNGTITPNTPLPIATTAPGQNAKYSFSASIGQRLSLNLTGVTIQSVKVTIQKPDGTTLATKSVGTSGGFIDTTAPLTVGGSYKVFVDPQSSYFGGITLGLYVVPPDQPGTMANGVAKPLTTTIPGQNAKWTFTTSSANQRVSFNFTNVTMASVRVSVRSASNALIFSRTFGTDGDFVEPFTIATAGTYTVTVDPQNASTGNVTVTYYLVPADATGSTSVTIGTPGQNGKLTTLSPVSSGTHTFTVSTTVPVADGQTQSVAISVYEGTVTDFAHFVGNSTSGPDGNSFQLSLPSTNTYTILVDPFGPATGSVTVTIS